MRWLSLAVQSLLAVSLVVGALVLWVWQSALVGAEPAWLAWLPHWIEIGMPIVYGIVALLAIGDAIQLAVRGDVRSLARGMVIAKLSAIPFFVLNFLGAVVVAVASLVRAGPLVAIVVPVMVVGTFCIMLPTSAYGIAALVRLRRDRVVGRGFLWTHLVLHVVFVADVVSSVLVAMRIRRLTRPPAPSPSPSEAAAVLPAR